MVKIEIDLSTRCRACLAEEPEMHHLYGDFDQGLKLADILENTTSFHADENDGLPPYLCENCTTVLVDFYNFRMVYQENENYIKSLLNNLKTCDDENEVTRNDEGNVETERECVKHLNENIEIEILKKGESENEELQAEYVLPEDIFPQYTEESEMGQFTVNNELVEIKEYIKYNCEECNKGFLIRSIFQQHMAEYHNIQNIEFDNYCKKTLIKVPIVKIEESDSFHTNVCKICKEEFETSDDFEKHMTVHKNYICEHCGAAFTKKSYMDDHKEMHLTVKKYKCQFCGKAFKRRTVLTKHRRIHTHPREIVCEVCGRRFNDKGTLRTHFKLKHIGSRNFQCTWCGLSFPLKSTLDKHMSRRHVGNREKKYVCNSCEMAYRDKSSLNRHVAIKHTMGIEKPSCGPCNKEYTTMTNLLKHMRKHHGHQ